MSAVPHAHCGETVKIEKGHTVTDADLIDDCRYDSPHTSSRESWRS